MARTRGGLVGNHDRGRDRGRGHEFQSGRVRLVELANISTRGRALLQASSPSSASIGNERDDILNVCTDSL